MALKEMALKMLGGAPSPSKESDENKSTVAPEKKGGSDDLMADLKPRFDNIKNQRLLFERQWYTNLAFYFGRQYVQWIASGAFSKLYEPPVPSWRVRMVVNKCRVVVRTELAKMMKERPRGFVAPSSGDDEDRNAAKIGDAIYEYLQSPSVLNLSFMLEQALFWTSTCGIGYQKVYYDKNKKDFSGAMGSIEVEAISPFHIRVPDMLQVDIEKQPYVIHETAKDTKQLESLYGVQLTPDSASSQSTKDSQFVNSLGITQELNKTMTTVREIWIKPCMKYPNGMMAVFTDEKVLYHYDGWPYEHGMYPFIKFDHIPTGKFYTDSTLIDVIPLQKEFNRTVSQIIEAKNKTSKPALLAAKGSIDPGKITSEPGLIIEFRPGTNPPTVMEPPHLPDYVIKFLEFSQAQLNDVSSQHEISKGSTPPGVTAATAISYLQEEDDSKLAFTIASIERGVEKIGKQVLALANQFWGEERQIKIVGEDSAWQLRQYSKEDMRGNTDFKVEVGSATPRSRAAKQAFIMELMDRGLPLPEAMKYLGMAETNQLYEDGQIDSRAAQKENLMFESGEIQEQWDRNDWDDDLVHLAEHNKFRKKQTYEAMDPDQKALLDQHVTIHKYHIAAKFGRMDLLPAPKLDPMTGQPVMDPTTGQPAMSSESPMLDGFIDGIRSGAIPAIIPPPPPSPQQLALQAHGGAVAQ